MKAKRLSRLTVEGLSDTGYVVGYESNIESEAVNDQQKVQDTLRIRPSISSIIPLDHSKADSLDSTVSDKIEIGFVRNGSYLISRDWSLNTGCVALKSFI